MSLYLAVLIAAPVIAVLLAAAAAAVCYRWGFDHGLQHARARHALARLEHNRAVRHA